MNTDPRDAQKLCTAEEFRLYEESKNPTIRLLSIDQVRGALYRASDLRAMWKARLEDCRHAPRVQSLKDDELRHAKKVRAQRMVVLFDEIGNSFQIRLHLLGEMLHSSRAVAVSIARPAETPGPKLKVRATNIVMPLEVAVTRK